jgi:hypothetical protein
MNTGTWTNKSCITSAAAWKWEKMSKKQRYILLGMWDQDDEAAYIGAGQAEIRPYFAGRGKNRIKKGKNLRSG